MSIGFPTSIHVNRKDENMNLQMDENCIPNEYLSRQYVRKFNSFRIKIDTITFSHAVTIQLQPTRLNQYLMEIKRKRGKIIFFIESNDVMRDVL